MSEILNDITQNKFINWIESSQNDGFRCIVMRWIKRIFIDSL